MSLQANTQERAWAESTSLLPANQPFNLLLQFGPDTIIPVCAAISLSAVTTVLGTKLRNEMYKTFLPRSFNDGDYASHMHD